MSASNSKIYIKGYIEFQKGDIEYKGNGEKQLREGKTIFFLQDRETLGKRMKFKFIVM